MIDPTPESVKALADLADRVESATPDLQAKMLDEAWETLAEHSAAFRRFAVAPLSSFGNKAGKFAMTMDAHAYESAALMLLPEGVGYNLDRYWIREGVRWKVEIATGGIPEQPRKVLDCWDAYTASLATAAAALRAHAHIGASHD